MIWQEVKIFTDDAGVDRLTAGLVELGVAGWQQESAADVRDYLAEGSAFDYADAGLQAKAAGSGAVFTLYIDDDAAGEELIGAIRRDFADLQVEVKRRDSAEWENNWREYYKPFRVGEKLLVCPSWEECEPKPGEKLLLIEPGSSFGTGQHYTTRLCLELLEQHMHDGARLLDLGCGTGILSIGGLHLGAKSAVAVDIEENAVAAAQENAAMNGYDSGCDGAAYTAICGDILADEGTLAQVAACAGGAGYDIIVVNIVADVIIAMSGLFAGLLAGAGPVLCSGVIDERRGDVLAAMERAGYHLLDEKAENGWCAFAFVRDEQPE